MSYTKGLPWNWKPAPKPPKQTKAQQAAAKEANKPTPAPTIAQARQDTTTYLDTIASQQQQQAASYADQLAQQSAAYQQQLASQSASLNTQITNLTQQSNAQVANYQTMLARVTSQQQNELESMRSMFANQNLQSESMISNLQTEIARLSKPAEAPVMDVDLAPAVVGISQATRQSGRRQRLGTKGGATPKPQVGALGLAIGT
jgi:seryl-tRNA synthetase